MNVFEKLASEIFEIVSGGHDDLQKESGVLSFVADHPKASLGALGALGLAGHYATRGHRASRKSSKSKKKSEIFGPSAMELITPPPGRKSGKSGKSEFFGPTARELLAGRKRK